MKGAGGIRKETWGRTGMSGRMDERDGKEEETSERRRQRRDVRGYYSRENKGRKERRKID